MIDLLARFTAFIITIAGIAMFLYGIGLAIRVFRSVRRRLWAKRWYRMSASYIIGRNALKRWTDEN